MLLGSDYTSMCSECGVLQLLKYACLPRERNTCRVHRYDETACLYVGRSAYWPYADCTRRTVAGNRACGGIRRPNESSQAQHHQAGAAETQREVSRPVSQLVVPMFYFPFFLFHKSYRTAPFLTIKVNNLKCVKLLEIHKSE